MVIPLVPKSSVWFTGRMDIIAQLKEYFLPDLSYEGYQKRKYFLLHGVEGIGKTQICLKFIEEMLEW